MVQDMKSLTGKGMSHVKRLNVLSTGFSITEGTNEGIVVHQFKTIESVHLRRLDVPVNRSLNQLKNKKSVTYLYTKGRGGQKKNFTSSSLFTW